MKLTLTISVILVLAGCGIKQPVESTSDTFNAANQSILTLTNNKGFNEVPKDKSFTSQRYSYIIDTEKDGSTFFDNKIIVRSFYLLHHAHSIIITGEHNVIEQYKEYMQSNGVKGDIILSEVPIYSNKVMIDTIHYSAVSIKR